MDEPLIVEVPGGSLGRLNDFSAKIFDKDSVWPVGAPVGVRSKLTGNILALGVVKSSTPGQVQIKITKQFS